MFASHAFVLCFSLFCFFSSSSIAQRYTFKAKNTFPPDFLPHTPINDEMRILASLHGRLLRVLFLDRQQKL